MPETIAEKREERRFLPHGHEDSDEAEFLAGFNEAAKGIRDWLLGDGAKEVVERTLEASSHIEEIDDAAQIANVLAFEVYSGRPLPARLHGTIAAAVEFGRFLADQSGQALVKKADDPRAALARAIDSGEAFREG